MPLGSISELPAESCNDIKANEGGHVVSGKYWIRVQTASSSQMALTYCNMENGGMYNRSKILETRHFNLRE